jgi:predicted RNase H-like HicB family nuclease
MKSTSLKIKRNGGSRVKTYVFKAEFEQDEDGRWSAWINALPGCTAWGYTQAEAFKALRDAAEAYVGDMAEAGEEMPTKGVEVIEAPVVTVTL